MHYHGNKPISAEFCKKSNRFYTLSLSQLYATPCYNTVFLVWRATRPVIYTLQCWYYKKSAACFDPCRSLQVPCKDLAAAWISFSILTPHNTWFDFSFLRQVEKLKRATLRQRLVRVTAWVEAHLDSTWINNSLDPCTLGHEWLCVKQPSSARDAFQSIPGFMSCAGWPGLGMYAHHACTTQWAGLRYTHSQRACSLWYGVSFVSKLVRKSGFIFHNSIYKSQLVFINIVDRVCKSSLRFISMDMLRIEHAYQGFIRNTRGNTRRRSPRG